MKKEFCNLEDSAVVELQVEVLNEEGKSIKLSTISDIVLIKKAVNYLKEGKTEAYVDQSFYLFQEQPTNIKTTPTHRYLVEWEKIDTLGDDGVTELLYDLIESPSVYDTPYDKYGSLHILNIGVCLEYIEVPLI